MSIASYSVQYNLHQVQSHGFKSWGSMFVQKNFKGASCQGYFFLSLSKFLILYTPGEASLLSSFFCLVTVWKINYFIYRLSENQFTCLLFHVLLLFLFH